MKDYVKHIKNLLNKEGYHSVTDIRQLPSSGSNRIYFRIYVDNADKETLLAAYNPDVSENIAWYSYTTHFRNLGFAVPEIYTRDEEYKYFLLQDMGTKSLFDELDAKGQQKVIPLYKKALSDLVRFQVNGIEGLDLDVAYPIKSFDRRSIMWDLNYFKYYFVKTHDIEFNENKLESDFQCFADVLLEANSNFFLYRDFQARNILVKENQLWYIDFQGGRKGPLQYDVVSLLYQAKAALSEKTREDLLEHYLDELEGLLAESREEFLKYYHIFIYFRLMQVLGAYGYRGMIQRKGHFLKSIPYAINNLKLLLADMPLAFNMPQLQEIFSQITELKQYSFAPQETKKLTINISSFSFKKSSYPTDYTENGGGFIFDCRSLPNPGRIAELRNFTGRDSQIINYLESKKEIADFINQATKLVINSVDNYLERGFSHLEVGFGCTGGMHRSVYSAEQLNKKLSTLYGDKIKTELKHLVIDGE